MCVPFERWYCTQPTGASVASITPMCNQQILASCVNPLHRCGIQFVWFGRPHKLFSVAHCPTELRLVQFVLPVPTPIQHAPCSVACCLRHVPSAASFVLLLNNWPCYSKVHCLVLGQRNQYCLERVVCVHLACTPQHSSSSWFWEQCGARSPGCADGYLSHYNSSSLNPFPNRFVI